VYDFGHTERPITIAARIKFQTGKFGFSQAFPRTLKKMCVSVQKHRIPKFPDLWAIFLSVFPVLASDRCGTFVPDKIFPITVTG